MSHFSYHNDYRTLTRLAGDTRLFKNANKRAGKAVINEANISVQIDKTYGHLIDNRGYVQVPVKNEVCECCEGEGTITNPSVDCDGYTVEDFRGDPDFEEAYFNGQFDIKCPECGGEKVVAVVDRSMIEAGSEIDLFIKALEEIVEMRINNARDRVTELKWGW